MTIGRGQCADGWMSDFRTNKPSDVISTLVSIYDSKDLFVRELQVYPPADGDEPFRKLEGKQSLFDCPHLTARTAG